MTVATEAPTALELGEAGSPRLLRWARRTWRVTDAPTPLEEAVDCALTHPLPAHGWRFQGTDTAGGDTLVFDVLATAAGWRVVKTYR